MQKRAQGAIEYLLIIGAAILVVAIVILAVTGVLSGGQTQTDTSEQSALDALRALKVTGMGYVIEIELSDASTWGGSTLTGSYQAFPDPNANTCTGPSCSCFQTPTIAKLVIDGLEVASFDLSGINYFAGQSQVFDYTFKGDPNTPHTLQVTFADCCCGGTDCGPTTCSDGKRRDKNFNLNKIKITNTDGKETLLTPSVVSSGGTDVIDFQ